MIEQDCRCIYRANVVADVGPSHAAPRDLHERQEIAEFLGTALMKPLHHSAQQHRATVEKAIDTMTIAERVAIEIEMTQRAKTMHSFDYDALR